LGPSCISAARWLTWLQAEVATDHIGSPIETQNAHEEHGRGGLDLSDKRSKRVDWLGWRSK
jgi:hypothetical protein